MSEYEYENEIVNGTIKWKNKEKGSLLLKESPKKFFNCPKDEEIRSKILKKLEKIEIGDKVELEMSGFLYIDIELIEKGNEPPKIPEERIKDSSGITTTITSSTGGFITEKEEERDYWEKKKLDDREYDKKKFLGMAKLNAMNNAHLLVTCLIENKVFTPIDLEYARGIVHTEKCRIYKELTGEDWG